MRHPFVGPGTERSRFACRRVALAPQVVREEWREDVAPVVSGGVTAEVDATERAPRAPRPATVIPGADDEKVLPLGVVTLE